MWKFNFYTLTIKFNVYNIDFMNFLCHFQLYLFYIIIKIITNNFLSSSAEHEYSITLVKNICIIQN